MTVSARARLRGTIGLSVLLVMIAAACGADGSDAAGSATPPAEDAPVATATTENMPAENMPTENMPAEAPEGLAARAELGYPRDLVERGRFNLVMTNLGPHDVVVVSKELDADFYDPAPPDDRRSILPAGGRPVALQTLFGEVDDCDDQRAVVASAVLTYMLGNDPTLHVSALRLDDAVVLDGIRAQRCTARSINASVDITFDDVEVDGEAFTVDLVLSRQDAADELVIEAIVGTVLFGAEAQLPVAVAPRIADPGVERFTLPLVFDVNRCDPHAVAETTKKYGLDLWVAVDGAEAQQVPIAIEPILGEFDQILETCKQRTGQ